MIAQPSDGPAARSGSGGASVKSSHIKRLEKRPGLRGLFLGAGLTTLVMLLLALVEVTLSLLESDPNFGILLTIMLSVCIVLLIALIASDWSSSRAVFQSAWGRAYMQRAGLTVAFVLVLGGAAYLTHSEDTKLSVLVSLFLIVPLILRPITATAADKRAAGILAGVTVALTAVILGAAAYLAGTASFVLGIALASAAVAIGEIIWLATTKLVEPDADSPPETSLPQ